MRITVADGLTLLRLILVPFFIAAFVMGSPGLALLLFSIAGASDLIDGSVARLLHQPTKLGAILDPLADKTLLETCFISLTIVGVLPWWFLVIALTRDVMITIGIFYLNHIKAKLPYRPTWSSKIGTLFQLMTAVAGLLLWWKPTALVMGWELRFLLQGSMTIALALIIISGIQYGVTGVRLLSSPHAISRP